MNTEMCSFLCLGGGKEMTIINYFFETVVPQILEYFKENKKEIPNYLMLEVLKKDKQYQELIDKRANKEKYSISKREYIKDKIHLSVLQDKNYERLTKAGFKLERGEKGTGTKHLTTQQLKSITKFYERQAYKSKKKIEKDYYKITGALYKTKKIPLTDTVIIDG